MGVFKGDRALVQQLGGGDWAGWWRHDEIEKDDEDNGRLVTHKKTLSNK